MERSDEKEMDVLLEKIDRQISGNDLCCGLGFGKTLLFEEIKKNIKPEDCFYYWNPTSVKWMAE